METKASWHSEGMNGRRPLVVSVAVSAMCHLLLFAGIVFFPSHASPRKVLPPVVSVDLVTMPSPGGDQDITPPTPKAPPAPEPPQVEKVPVPEKPAPVATPVKPPAPPEPEVKPVPLAPPRASEAPRKAYRKKVSLKKKTFRGDTLVKSAIEKIERRVADNRPSPVEEAISRLKTRDAETDYKQRLLENIKNRVAVHGTGGVDDNGGQGAELLQIYKIEIAYQVQQHWAFPDQLAGSNKDLKALLVFKVLPNGEIRDLFFTEKSGNPYLDESAYRAVIKSNPVHPHPDGVVKPYITVGLRFTPEGVQ